MVQCNKVFLCLVVLPFVLCLKLLTFVFYDGHGTESRGMFVLDDDVCSCVPLCLDT